MGKSTKVIKLKIVKPLYPTTSWKVFASVMKELHKETRLASNKVIALYNYYYSNSLFDEDLDFKGLQNKGYAIARECAPSLQSYNSNSISKELYDNYFGTAKTRTTCYKYKIEHGEGNPPMDFGKDMPIPIAGKKYFKFEKTENGHYNFSFPLFSRDRKKEWNNEMLDKEECFEMKDGVFKVGIDTTQSYVSSIIERCIAGEYAMGGSKIVKKIKDGKTLYYIHLTYHSETCSENNILDKNKVLGIDLGCNSAVACAVNYNDYTRRYFGGKIILKEKLKYERMLRDVQKEATVSNRKGHGRKNFVKTPDSIRHKKKNFTERTNRNIAAKVVEFAVKQGCGTINMEYLKGFYKKFAGNRYLKQWTYYQLQQYIEEKAKQAGINVVYVDPRYTSQTCSKCGCVHEENRPKTKEKGAEYFGCIECGFETNADFNAARNISMREEMKKNK